MLGGDGIGASLEKGQSAMAVEDEEEKDELEITYLATRVTQPRPSCNPVPRPMSPLSSSPSAFSSVLRDLSMWSQETCLELVASRLLKEFSSLCRRWEKYSPLAQEQREKEEEEDEEEGDGRQEGKGGKHREGCELPIPGERGLLEEVRREIGGEREKEGVSAGLEYSFTHFPFL